MKFHTESAGPPNARSTRHWQGFGPRVAPVHEVRKTDARLHGRTRTGGEPGFIRLF